MQTPPISAALPPASSSAARTQQTDGQANESSFSAVLTGQQSTRQKAAETPASGTAATTGTAATAGTTSKPGDKKTPASDRSAPDEAAATTQAAAQAQAAAEQGLGLPQIALDIASQAAAAAAAQHPVTARGAAPTGAAGQATVLPDALADEPATTGKPLPAQPLLDAAGKTAASLPLPATAALADQTSNTALTAQVPAAGIAAALPASLAVASGNKAMALTGAQQARLAAQSQKPEPASGKAALAPAAAAAAVTASVGVSGASDAATSRLAATAAFADTAQPAATPANGSFAAAMPSVQVLNNPAPGTLPFTSAQPAVASPLQSPQWSTDFGRQFISLTQGGHNMPHTAELRLDPPELGPLRITINISDNVAHAIFASPHAAVRQTVESALPQLQQMLAQAGISLGQTTVNDQAQQEQAYNETFGGSRKGSPDANAAGTGTDGAVMANQTAARQIAANALVDTFA